MISTKNFSVKKTSILVLAVFTMAITIGLGPVSSSMAVTNFINCNTEGDDDSTDNQINTVTSCHKETNKGTDDSNDKSKTTASSNDDNDDESDDNVDVVKSAPQNIATNKPAVASPEDNIIKPINLNKGFALDKPLETNNAKHVQSNEGDDKDGIKSKNVIQDELSPNFGNKFDKSSSMSELYDSFDLPYTALYKN